MLLFFVRIYKAKDNTVSPFQRRTLPPTLQAGRKDIGVSWA